MALAALKRLFHPSPLRRKAHDGYLRLVAQARLPVFYRDWAVPDTLDGRFDIIILHLCLAQERCEREKNDARAEEFSRNLSEIFFDDMDRSLREMGASDTGVGIRVKKMAQAYYGRRQAYTEALNDEAALATALQRNVYREQPDTQVSAQALAAYMRRNWQAIQDAPFSSLLEGNWPFLR